MFLLHVFSASFSGPPVGQLSKTTLKIPASPQEVFWSLFWPCPFKAREKRGFETDFLEQVQGALESQPKKLPEHQTGISRQLSKTGAKPSKKITTKIHQKFQGNFPRTHFWKILSGFSSENLLKSSRKL